VGGHSNAERTDAIQEALAQGYGVNGDAKKARRFQETAESAARDLALLEEVLRRL